MADTQIGLYSIKPGVGTSDIHTQYEYMYREEKLSFGEKAEGQIITRMGIHF